MNLTLLPVYSRLADHLPDELRRALPPGWRLSQHQVETYAALVGPEGPPIVINTAMTGDGKSLAGQLPHLLRDDDHPTFAMYPTNELVHDQGRQAQETFAHWGKRPVLTTLDSAVLDQRMEQEDAPRRGDVLLSLLKNRLLVLTNPDIFHYIMQAFYRFGGRKGDAADRIIGPLLELFNQFTFDEFHLFDAPQVVSVMNALLLMQRMAGTQRKPFLFQSATPSPLLQTFLTRAGLPFREIGGNYCTEPGTGEADRWRRILHRARLTLAEGSVEAWLEENLDSVLIPFFLARRPAAKGAIIVNSIAGAKRIMARLAPALHAHGLSVGENTGLSGKATRRAAYDCDLLVGTSTVDVGVDFRINFLLFESRDAGSFLQRLGRLGRHDGYTRDGRTIPFGGDFVAHALLPPWALEAVGQTLTEQAPAANDEGIARPDFAAALETAYPAPAPLAGYARSWGALQSVRVISAFSEFPVRAQYADIRQQLAQDYQRVFQINFAAQIARYNALRKDAPVLLDEATAFRGGSYLNAALLDPSEPIPADRFKVYDLLWLAANAVLEPLDEGDFWDALHRAHLSPKPLQRHQPLAFYRLAGFRSERVDFRLFLEQTVGEWDTTQFGVARPLRGVTLHPTFAGELPDLGALNRTLARQTVPGFVCLGHAPLPLKQRLRLPLLFKLYAFTSRDGLSGSLAIGREALLLDVAARARGLDCGGSAIFA